MWNLDGEQLFVKSTDFPLPIDKMDLQNPMSLPPLLIKRAHGQVALGVNVERHLIVSDPFVRKLPDEVPGDRPPKLPVVFRSQ